MSRYCVHCEPTVWFAVVQEPLAQVWEVSHIIRYCVPELEMVAGPHRAAGGAGSDQRRIHQPVVGLLIGGFGLGRLGLGIGVVPGHAIDTSVQLIR